MRAGADAPPISARWIVTGLVLGAAMAAASGDGRIAPALVVLGLLVTAVIEPDLAERRIPNRTLLVAGPLLVAAVVLAGALHDDPARVVVAVSTGALLFGGILLAAIAAPGALGMGDVKLIGIGSIGLGWFGVQPALVATGLAFGLAGVIGLIARRRGGWTDGVPFAPFYAIGTTLVAVATGLGG